MILGSYRIEERIRKEKLLENHPAENIQGAGVDLRIGKAYRLKSGGKLGREERILPAIEEINGDRITLEAGEYVLVETMERVNMPKDLMARVLPRSSLFRCGVSLRNAVVDPNYHGTLIFGLKNESEHAFELEKGARIAQIVFEEVDGEATPYSGRYQGGKVV